MLTGQDLTLATTFFESYQVCKFPLMASRTVPLTPDRLSRQDSFKRKKRRTIK